MPLLSLLTVWTLLHLLHLPQSAEDGFDILRGEETADNTIENELAQYVSST